jgi:predicted nucleotidyltransferase component of viral defense system
MLSTLELKRLTLKEGVPGATVEKDYILSVLLKVLANTDLSTKAVFMGGTAIRKVYFKDARFSEDLDFTTSSIDRAGCLDILRSTLEGKEYDGVKFGIIEEERTSAGLKAAVKYTGPLNHAQRIRFDFSFRDNLVEKPKEMELFDIYKVGSAKMHVLSIEEVFAEKLHALGSRVAPRDLYDVWFLMGKGIKVDKKVLDRKFAFYNEKFDAKKAIDNSKKGEENWEKDLQHFLKEIPDCRKLRDEVEIGLSKLWA